MTTRLNSLVLAGLLAVCGSALAQDGGALKGPPVRQDRPPVQEDGFGGELGRRRGGDRGVPMREYMEAINTLRGDKAPANLRLSAEQDQKLQAIAADFRKEMEAFREKARSEGMDARAGGAKPERDANRARMEELRGEMPKPADYQTKAFAVLNADQQKHVQAEIEKLREGMEKRRGEEMMKRREGGQPGGPGPGGPGGARDEGAQRERVQKIMEKLRSLSPEERDRVLSRLEEQLQRMGGEGGQPPERRRGRQGGNAGENPPPPPPGNR